jgi:asparagine synthase (glutamine-hydrolysing)
VFASEIKALLADFATSRAMDEETLARYLLEGRIDGDDRTFFENVKQLRPGHVLIVDKQGRFEERAYWRLERDRIREDLSLGAAAEEFRKLFFDAVRLRLRSDVPVGSSLSGGLDSSSIVCTVRHILSGEAPQNTFSARHRSSPVDEGPYIEAVVAHTGVHDRHVWIDGERAAADLDRFVWFQDEPVAHTSQYAQWKVMELARDCGVTVLLDGQGADEVLGGYPSPTFGYRYAELLRGGRIVELFHELIAFRQNHGSVGPAFKYATGALLDDRARRAVRTRYHSASHLVMERKMPALPRTTAPRKLTLQDGLYETLAVTSLPGLLRYGDRSSMAFSREVRLPFLDHGLVEFVYSLPSSFLVQKGATKVLLRRAMAGIIPDRVRTRMDKIGFGTPERDWFVGPLRPLIGTTLEAVKRRRLVRADVVDRQWRNVLAGEGNTGNVWRLVNLELWLRQFVDHSRVADISLSPPMAMKG